MSLQIISRELSPLGSLWELLIGAMCLFSHCGNFPSSNKEGKEFCFPSQRVSGFFGGLSWGFVPGPLPEPVWSSSSSGPPGITLLTSGSSHGHRLRLTSVTLHFHAVSSSLQAVSSTSKPALICQLEQGQEPLFAEAQGAGPAGELSEGSPSQTCVLLCFFFIISKGL